MVGKRPGLLLVVASILGSAALALPSGSAQTCPPDTNYCFKSAEDRVAMTVDCASQFVVEGDLGAIEATLYCSFGLQTSASAVVVGVPDSNAPTLAPGAHGSIYVSLQYHPAQGAKGRMNYTLVLNPNVDGITWSSDTTIRGEFGANRSSLFETEVHFNVSATSRTGSASIPFAFWHGAGSGLHRDILAFNIVAARTPGLEPVAVLAAAGVSFAVVALRRRRG